MKYVWIIHFKTLSFGSVLNIEIIFNTKTMESTVLQFNSVGIHLRADFESGDTFVFGPVDVKHCFSLNIMTPAYCKHIASGLC